MILFKSIESIEPQINSKLVQDLNKAVSDVIKFRDEISGKTKIKSVVTKVEKEFLPEIIKIIKKHTGLNNNNFYLMSQPCGLFGISVFIENDEEALSVIKYNSVGIDIKKYLPKQPITTAKDMDNIVKNFDKQTSKNKINQVNNNEIKYDFYFDPYVAFLSKETIHSKLPRLTSLEIVSIIIHEIGHIMTLLEHANITYMKINILPIIT